MRRIIGVPLASAATFAAVLVSSISFTSAVSAEPAFDRWVSEFWSTAQSAGISRQTYRRAFSGVTPDAEVLKKARFQPEFVQPLWIYVEKAVSDDRIADGRARLTEYRQLLDRMEQRYGVDRHILVAIWGMESSYGTVLDNPKIVKSVVRSLATLAYADPRRAKFARTQLVSALKIVQNGDVALEGLKGSWAGAMGHTQFIPTTYEAFAVDFDGDGHRNVWTSPVDALASAANYLNKSGWVSGKTWGYEVILPRNFEYGLADGDRTQTIAEWTRLGIRRARDRRFPRPSDRAILVLPAGADGPGFLMLRNHYVIKRYNNATAYALAIGHLADRLRGGPPFKQSWPQDTRLLQKAELREIQAILARGGYYRGAIDGKIGPVSVRAIRSYQQSAGRTPDGFVDAALLAALRGG